MGSPRCRRDRGRVRGGSRPRKGSGAITSVQTVSVAGEVEFTGTNSGPMIMAGKEMPPTNRTVIGRGAYFARVRDGKIVEFKAYPDIAGMMAQLGFMPEM